MSRNLSVPPLPPLKITNARSGIIRQSGSSNSGINLGGIGTGGVEIWPDGRLHQWCLTNCRPWAGYQSRPGHPQGAPEGLEPGPMDADFFIRAQVPGRRPLYRWLFTGHGLTAGTISHFFRHHKYFFLRTPESIEYEAEFPFARLHYNCPGFPVEVSLTAWTPFIPRQVRDSSLPGCFFDFRVCNLTDEAVEVSLVWQLQNLAGHGCPQARQRHQIFALGRTEGVLMEGDLNHPDHPTSGNMALWAESRAGQKISRIAANPFMQNVIWSIHRTGGLEGALLPEHIQREELIDPCKPEMPNKGWIAVQQAIEPDQTTAFHLGMSWFFPNHISNRGTRVGHMYENWFSDAREVACELVSRRTELEAGSREMPALLMGSTLPEKLRLSLLDQLSTLTKSTFFIRDGRFGLQEGHGCCAFNTMDVDHYSSYALSLLFPELRATVLHMHAEMAHPENGKIYHGFPGTVEKIPPGGGADKGYNRWDCSVQYVLQLYRDAKWSGNQALLEEQFPVARRALELIAGMDYYGLALPYIEGGITYDHWRMKGIVTYMAGLYLAALRAMEDMARLLGEHTYADLCRARFETGRESFESRLWNGSQYLLFYGRRPPGWTQAAETRGHEGHLHPPRPPEELCCPSGASSGDPCCCERDPAWIEVRDTGVMTDLLNGNATAAVMGLGAFLNPERVNRQLDLILERNSQEENLCVVNGTYPDEHFLDEWPFMQWQTPWTGSEYFLALQLYAAGKLAEGDRVVNWVFDRHRHEGMRFDHSECNNHYARPLCLWGAWAMRVGCSYDALGRILTINPKTRPWRFSGLLPCATATALLRLSLTAKRTHLQIEVSSGSIVLSDLILPPGSRTSKASVILDGVARACHLERLPQATHLRFPEIAILSAGGTLTVQA